MFENGLLAESANHKELEKLLKKRSKKIRRDKSRELEDEGDQYSGDELVLQAERVIKQRKSGRVYDDSEQLQTIKNFGPEDTYEIWLHEKHINKNFDKFLEKPVKKSKKNSNHELFKSTDRNSENKSGGVVEDTENEDLESSNEDSKDSRFALAKGRYKIRKQGLEILPHLDSIDENDNTASYILANRLSYSRKHTFVLTKLLHINILKRNWQTAYRCFTILIRIQYVDIRSIWPLGIEILTRLSEENYKSIQPENSVSSYQLRTIRSQDMSAELGQFKDEQFLTWLQNFYPPTISKNPTSLKVPQAYRVSSKNTAPLFVLTLIWTLIMRQDFQKVNDKLSELLLQPPYINDGTFHFLQGFSYQLEASLLSQESSMDKSKIEMLISDAKKYYKEAKDKNAEFPEELVNRELNFIVRKISDIDMDMGNEDEKLNITTSSIISEPDEETNHQSILVGSPSNRSSSGSLYGIKTEQGAEESSDLSVDDTEQIYGGNDTFNEDDKYRGKYNSSSDYLSSSP